MFLRRISGLSKLAAWFLVIFVSDSIWSSFLLTILGRKLFYSLFVQTVKSLSKRKCPWILGLLRCISNHPVHIRRWSPLKLKKKKKRKGKKKKGQEKDKQTKRGKQIHAKPLVMTHLFATFHCFQFLRFESDLKHVPQKMYRNDWLFLFCCIY